MPIINPTLPNDGETADAADVNSVFTAILGVLNGNVDSDNLADNAVTSAKLASGAITLAKIADGLLTPQKLTVDYQAGWQAAAGSFAYISATTLSVAAADALNISPGTKLKFTQTTVKYFYVLSISGTTVTIVPTSDYTLANAAITSPFYSNATTPTGFPGFFNWTPTLTGWSANPANAVYRYTMNGRRISLMVRQGTPGTSNSGAITITAPAISANIANHFFGNTVWDIQDNGGIVSSPTGRVILAPNSNVINAYKDIGLGGWTAANGKGTSFILDYEV